MQTVSDGALNDARNKLRLSSIMRFNVVYTVVEVCEYVYVCAWAMRLCSSGVVICLQ